MVRDGWYAAAFAAEVRDAPCRSRVLGTELVLYYGGEGAVHAVGARCPHRGCDLSLGRADGEDLICPFHGWRFGEDGKCLGVPAHPDMRFSAGTARIPTYAAQEWQEIVWVNLSFEARSPEARESFERIFPPFPEVGSGWTSLRFDAVWNAHFTRVVESVIDVSHLPFVHPETTGTQADPRIKRVQYKVSPKGILVWPSPFYPSHPMEPRPHAVETDGKVEIELRFPNHWIIRTPMGDWERMCTYLTFTPLDPDSTRIFGVALRNFDRESTLLNEFHVAHTQFVMEQDRHVVECLRPKAAPFDLKQETHVPSDAPSIAYRRMLQRALARKP